MHCLKMHAETVKRGSSLLFRASLRSGALTPLPMHPLSCIPDLRLGARHVQGSVWGSGVAGRLYHYPADKAQMLTWNTRS